MSSPQTSCFSRLRNWRWLRFITVEPVLGINALAAGLSYPASNLLWYSKVCLNEYPEYVCDNLHNETFEDEESWVQKTASQWSFYSTLCTNIPALVFSIIYGSWSDLFGRKIPMVIPMVGSLIHMILYLLNAIFLMGPLWMMLPGSIISGCCGAGVTLYSSCFSYLSEVTTDENRTVRTSLVYSMVMFMAAVATFLSGVIFDNTGFIFVYSLAISFLLLDLAYIVVWIQDIGPKSQISDHRTSQDENKEPAKLNSWEQVKRLFGIYHIKDAFMILVHKRSPRKQAHLIALLSVLFYSVIISAGGVVFLYLVHLGFTQTLYGYYLGYTSTLHGLVLLFLVPMMKRRLHISDTLLVMLSISSSIISLIALAYITEIWMVFITPLLGLFSSAFFPCMRSLLSQIVVMEEQGKVMALVGCIESIGNMVSSALYSFFIYPATYDDFPGFSFVLEAILQMVTLSALFALHIDIKGLANSYGLMEEESIVEKTVDEDLGAITDGGSSGGPSLTAVLNTDLTSESTNGVTNTGLENGEIAIGEIHTGFTDGDINAD